MRKPCFKLGMASLASLLILDPVAPTPALGASSFSISATRFSLGAKVGGPDELQDTWTNRGYSKTGQNLTPGVVAVNRTRFSLGTLFRDPATGYCYIAADIHGNKNASVIDFYQTPSQYGKKALPSRLSKVGKVAKVGSTPEEIRRQLTEACGRGSVPPGESAKDWLAGKRGPSGTDEARPPLQRAQRPSVGGKARRERARPDSGFAGLLSQILASNSTDSQRARYSRRYDRNFIFANKVPGLRVRASGAKPAPSFRGRGFSAR